MLGVLRLTAFILTLYTCDAAFDLSRRVDCVVRMVNEIRTRGVMRYERNGGQPCTGKLEEYRAVGAQPLPGPEEFSGNLLAGNTPSYNLAGGGRYTLSRDILLVIDNTVDVVIFPYYKSFISNIVGKICGDIGARLHGTRLHVARLDASFNKIHSFNVDQNREVIQDEILRIARSPDSSANLKSIRGYNNATNEVIFVTTERGCGAGLQDSADKLKATAEVYVIVLAKSTNQNSCLQNLVSSPFESHFLWLKGITEISEQPEILQDQSSAKNFCFYSSSSP